MAAEELPRLPDKDHPNLYLTHPTEQEKQKIWLLNSKSWGGALSPLDYVAREEYLMTVPLAVNGGVTHWILVDKTHPPDERPIFGSCETLCKRSLISDKDSQVIDVISHGVGSVFCDPQFRGKGYAGRMMKELGEKLRNWQTGATGKTSAFSVLWSDIGPTYYARFGWQMFPSTHIEFPPVAGHMTSLVKPLASSDLDELCSIDEKQIRRSMENSKDGKIQVAILPDNDHMQWHHKREDFLCDKIFGQKPTIKGAIIGEPGQRMWAIWTRSFYGPLEAKSGNTLHILRLVIENADVTDTFSSTAEEPSDDSQGLDKEAEKLKAIIQAAQGQAAEWKVNHVELWNPTVLVRRLVDRIDITHSKVKRDNESIASLFWYGEGSGTEHDLEWVGNEKYGWC